MNLDPTKILLSTSLRSGSTRRESTGSSPAATSASSSLKKAASLSSSQPPHVQKRIGSRSPLASSSSLATDHPSTREDEIH